MNPLLPWAPTIVAAVTMIFTAGLLTGKLRDHDKRLDDHHDILKGHGERLEDHGLKIGKMEAWRDGYNAGSGANRGTGGNVSLEVKG